MFRNGQGDQPTLCGPRVRLRPWREDDADVVLAGCQDAEIQRWTEVPVPYRRGDAESFVGPYAAGTWSDGGGAFAVEPREGGPLVGSMTLFRPRDGVGTAGYWTVAEHRGRGWTGEALRVLTHWAFEQRGLRRMQLIVDPRNDGSRRVADSAGYLAEGTLRQRSLHRGVPVDDVVYGLLATDPRPRP